MTKLRERREAIEFRKEGKSYSEILKAVKASKSSLSLWLRNIPLSEEQIARIKDTRKRAVERYRQTMRLKREKRDEQYYKEQRKKWLPFSEREEFIAGLFLYWGEGNKASRNSLGLSNTDPSVVKFYLYWLVKSLNVPKTSIRVQVHLYNDMDIDKELNFWSKELSISKNQFMKPYIKNTKKVDIDQKGFGHGTCGIWVHKTVLKENALMAIKAVSDYFETKIDQI